MLKRSTCAWAFLAVAAFASARDARAQSLAAEVTASSPLPGDSFGKAISLTDSEVLVGGSYWTSLFYRRDGGTPADPTDDSWQLGSQFSTQGTGDDFGDAVSLSGDLLLIGAPNHGGSFAGPGAVYAFRRNDHGTLGNVTDDTWDFESLLTAPPEAGFSTWFGAAVDHDPTWAVIGASGSHLEPAPLGEGMLHVFRRTDNGTPTEPTDDSWQAHQFSIPRELAPGDSFGNAVALHNEHLVVAAPSHDALGAVFSYWRDEAGTPEDPTDDTWTEGMVIVPPVSFGGLAFGRDLALGSDLLIVGALDAALVYARDDRGTVSDPSDDQWEYETSLVPEAYAPFGAYGFDVALSEDLVLVGAQSDDEARGGNAGAAYLFRRNEGGAWEELVKLFAPVPEGLDKFGTDIAMYNGRAVIGEPGYFAFLQADSFSGTAHVFLMNVDPWEYVAEALPGSMGALSLYGTGSLTAASPVVVWLTNAPASSTVTLVVGLSAVNAPLKGGVLVPAPQVLLPLSTTSIGESKITAAWPAGVPAGVTLWLQAWTPDAGGIAGFAASNALRATVP